MKKIYIVVALALIIVFGANVLVFASEVETPKDYLKTMGYDVTNFDVYYSAYPISQYDYVVTKLDNNTNAYVLIAEKGLKVYRQTQSDGCVRFGVYNTVNDTSKQYYLISVSKNGNLNVVEEYQVPHSSYTDFLNSYNSDGEMWGFYGEILYTTVNVYNDCYGEEVFFKPSLPSPTLQTVTKEMTMTEVMKQIIGLLPLGIGLVISVVALRKGLVLLQTVLHQA